MQEKIERCEKVPHTRDGYLHSEDDDGPYDVDGVKYCGRCHRYGCRGFKQPAPEPAETTEADMVEVFRCPKCGAGGGNIILRQYGDKFDVHCGKCGYPGSELPDYGPRYTR